jgi:Zn-dependent protease
VQSGLGMQSFSAQSLTLTFFLAVSLLIALDAREYARASTAARFNDPTPRLWGRLTFNPKSWFDPFGSGLLPGLLLLLWAAVTVLPPIVAYGKPAPVDPNYLRSRVRDSVLVGLAGPLTNIAFAVAAGIVLRAGLPSTASRALGAFVFVNLCMAFFHLLPIPGLDGARLVGLALPERPAQLYRNADAYLPLFVLVAMFLLGGPLKDIIFGLTNAVCRASSGRSCVDWMFLS